MRCVQEKKQREKYSQRLWEEDLKDSNGISDPHQTLRAIESPLCIFPKQPVAPVFQRPGLRFNPKA